MNILEALKKMDSVPESSLYRASNAFKLIHYNKHLNSFFAYTFLRRENGIAKARFEGECTLTRLDIEADDWELYSKPFNVVEY